ncbi:MAG: hypothetical protein Q8L81_08950 [Bacteroidota bacterium]|nr:hypothetical protein [Bacteroidota bacterium]
MINIEKFKKAKEIFSDMKKSDCIGKFNESTNFDDSANVLSEFYTNNFSVFFLKDNDFRFYITEDIKEIQNRAEMMEYGEIEFDFVKTRINSLLDLFQTLIEDTENELKKELVAS